MAAKMMVVAFMVMIGEMENGQIGLTCAKEMIVVS